MTQQLETLITLLLYTLFFAWIGYQRGSLREIIVTVAAVGGWLALQEAGSLLIRIVNLGSKFVAFVRAGGLGENPDQAFGALGSAAPWVTTEQRGEFLFIVWVFLLIFAYVISNLKPFAKASKSDAWSILLGIVNGLFFPFCCHGWRHWCSRTIWRRGNRWGSAISLAFCAAPSPWCKAILAGYGGCWPMISAPWCC